MEFEAQLQDLKGASASQISNLTKLALKKSYKEVVHSIEKTILKSKPENRLAFFYLIDSICKASKGNEKYQKRFEEKLPNMLTNPLVPKDQEKLKRLLSLWKKDKVFSVDFVNVFENNSAPVKAVSPAVNGPPPQVADSAVPLPEKPPQLESLPNYGAVSAPIGVGSLLSSVIHNTGNSRTSSIPTMDQLNSLLNIPAPSVAPLRDPSSFDYGDDDEEDVFKSPTSAATPVTATNANPVLELLKAPFTSPVEIDSPEHESKSPQRSPKKGAGVKSPVRSRSQSPRRENVESENSSPRRSPRKSPVRLESSPVHSEKKPRLA